MKRSVLTGSAALAALGGATLAGCAPTPAPYVPPEVPPPALGCYADPAAPAGLMDLDIALTAAAGVLGNAQIYSAGTNCTGNTAVKSYVAAPDAVTAGAACLLLDPPSNGEAHDLSAYTSPESLAGYYLCSNK